MILLTFVEATVGAVGVSLVAGIGVGVKMLWNMQTDVRRLVRMDTHRATDIEQIARVQRPLLNAAKASLEALRDGKCNGNVGDAHLEIAEYAKNYDSYLSTLIRRGR